MNSVYLFLQSVTTETGCAKDDNEDGDVANVEAVARAKSLGNKDGDSGSNIFFKLLGLL